MLAWSCGQAKCQCCTATVTVVVYSRYTKKRIVNYQLLEDDFMFSCETCLMNKLEINQRKVTFWKLYITNHHPILMKLSKLSNFANRDLLSPLRYESLEFHQIMRYLSFDYQEYSLYYHQITNTRYFYKKVLKHQYANTRWCIANSLVIFELILEIVVCHFSFFHWFNRRKRDRFSSFCGCGGGF